MAYTLSYVPQCRCAPHSGCCRPARLRLPGCRPQNGFRCFAHHLRCACPLPPCAATPAPVVRPGGHTCRRRPVRPHPSLRALPGRFALARAAWCQTWHAPVKALVVRSRSPPRHPEVHAAVERDDRHLLCRRHRRRPEAKLSSLHQASLLAWASSVMRRSFTMSVAAACSGELTAPSLCDTAQYISYIYTE